MLLLEAVGGIVIFVARLVAGTTPGESLHVLGGLVMVPVYALYQWRHWSRVSPLRPRLDYAIGVLAALCMVLALVTGLLLGVSWWQARFGAERGEPQYPALLSAAHNIGSMLVLTFAGAHLGAVLMRDRNGRH